MAFGIKTLGRFLRLFRKSEDGGPTIEFVLVFTPFFILAVSSFELGLLMTRHAMLERGVDMAVREVRINTGTDIDEDDFKVMVCNSAGLIPNCLTQLRIEMIPVDLRVANGVSVNTVPRDASCENLGTFNPALRSYQFTQGLPNQMMVVRACGLFSPMLPETALGWFLSRMDESDRYYRLVATTAFVMEPV